MRMFTSMTVTDHLAASLERLPIAVIAILIGALFLFRRTAGKLTEAQAVRRLVIFQLGDEDFGPIARSYKSLIAWTIFDVMFALLISMSVGLILLFGPALDLWTCLMLPAAAKLRMLGATFLIAPLYFVPLFMIMALLWGVSMAAIDLAKTKGDYSVDQNSRTRT